MDFPFEKLTLEERSALANKLFDAEDDIYRVYHDGKMFWWPNGARESARGIAFEMYELAYYVTHGRNYE